MLAGITGIYTNVEAFGHLNGSVVHFEPSIFKRFPVKVYVTQELSSIIRFSEFQKNTQANTDYLLTKTDFDSQCMNLLGITFLADYFFSKI